MLACFRCGNFLSFDSNSLDLFFSRFLTICRLTICGYMYIISCNTIRYIFKFYLTPIPLMSTFTSRFCCSIPIFYNYININIIIRYYIILYIKYIVYIYIYICMCVCLCIHICMYIYIPVLKTVLASSLLFFRCPHYKSVFIN